MFATHPSPEERQEALKKLADATPSGVTNKEKWCEKTRPFVHEWLNDEVKRGQHEESLELLTRMIADAPAQAEFAYARCEAISMRRLRITRQQ